MSEQALGVVLKTTPLRESDLLITLYTDTHGRISAVARGARRSQRRFAGALSLLVLAKFELGRKPRGELWSLESADIVREWTRLATDVIAVAHASYVAELVSSLLPAEAPDPDVLELVVAAWDSLADHGPSPAALRAVELRLLDISGHRPAIDQCAICGATDLDTGAVFDGARGGAICRRCAAMSRGAGVRVFEATTRAYLGAVLAAGTPSEAQVVDGQFSATDRLAARDVVLAMVRGLVGKPLRSLEYIAKLGAAQRGTDAP